MFNFAFIVVLKPIIKAKFVIIADVPQKLYFVGRKGFFTIELYQKILIR